MNTSPAFLEALHAEAQELSTQFPHLAARLAKATTAIELGRVWPEDDGVSAMVQSKRDAAVWYHVNGDCPCAASEHRQEVCYHRLAARLYARVAARLEADEERYELTAQVPADTPTIPAEAIVLIQGKQFIRFEGLLHLAHERGLVELSTTIVSVASDLAVCQSTARFPDGRVFTDIGDASPSNVKHHLAPHFIRMAATRASARALRRALNIDACSVEELGD